MLAFLIRTIFEHIAGNIEFKTAMLLTATVHDAPCRLLVIGWLLKYWPSDMVKASG